MPVARHPLLLVGLLGLSLAACDEDAPDVPEAFYIPQAVPPGGAPAPTNAAAPVTVATPTAPPGHQALWDRYLQSNPADADAGWIIDGGGLPETHRAAMWMNLQTTFRATHWALARSVDYTRVKLVVGFATSGDALKMLNWDPTGTRYNTLVAFAPAAQTVTRGAALQAQRLLNTALTRLNVVRTQLAAYATTHQGTAPNLSAGWHALTGTQPPLLTEAPVNPLTGSTRVAATPGPDVGWIHVGNESLKLSVPRAWIHDHPRLAADALPFE